MGAPVGNLFANSSAARIAAHLHHLAVRRSVRLTSDGIKFLFFTIGIGIAAINTGNNLLYLLLAMMLSFVIISGILSELCLRWLTFQRHVPDLIIADQPTTVTLSVSNRSPRLSSFSVRLYDVVDGRDVDRGLYVGHLPSHRTILLSYPVLATRRGRIYLEGIRAETLFPFGLFIKRALFPVKAEILVGPSIQPLSLRFVEEIVSEGQGLSLPRRGHGAELYNLRLYRAGDDSRAIHWMTTARTSQLIVRETEAEDQRRITILLSTIAPDPDDELFERSVRLAASILWHLSKNSYPVRLIVESEDSGHGLGSDHLFAMMRLLALCKRRRPDERDGSSSIAHSRQNHWTELGYVVAIVPWSSHGDSIPAVHAHRILHASLIEELTHAT